MREFRPHGAHPLFHRGLACAAGAGGRDAAPLRLHDAVTLGALGMDCYAFGSGAPALQAALA